MGGTNDNQIRYQNVVIKNYRQDKQINIPEYIKNKLTIKEDAGHGFILPVNDC